MTINYEMQFNGFHGTIEYFAKRILTTKRFKTEYREDHWLGQGVYFYKDDYDQAYWWAGNTRKKANRSGKYTYEDLEKKVIQCNFKVMSENVINLDSNTGKRVFKEEHQRVLRTQKGVKFKYFGDDDEHRYRCAIIDLFDSRFKVIQCTFIESREILANADSLFKQLGIVQNGVQVCVRDHDVLDNSEMFLVETKKRVSYGSSLKSGSGTFEIKRSTTPTKKKAFHYGSEKL